MAYGLQIDGANNTFIADTTLPTVGFLPVVVNNGTVNAWQTYGGYQLGDLIFARPDGGTLVTADFRNPSAPKAGEDQDFILLRSSGTSGLAVNNNGSTYGLQIYNAGGTLAYDSRHTGNGFNIKAVKGFDTLDGGLSTNTSSGNLIYSGASSSTYALVNGCFNHDYGAVEAKIGYHFSGSNIYFVGWWSFTWGGVPQTGELINFDDRIVGDLL